MLNLVRSAWADVVSLIFRRPSAVQLAALCWRDRTDGREVLLVTSSKGRWILPKGWPIDGLDGKETALREAWEEAGVRDGRAGPDPVACFDCIKQFDTGQKVRCHVEVYPVEVTSIASDYPESARRNRTWVSLAKAQELVDEPGLRHVLEGYAAAA